MAAKNRISIWAKSITDAPVNILTDSLPLSASAKSFPPKKKRKTRRDLLTSHLAATSTDSV